MIGARVKDRLFGALGLSSISVAIRGELGEDLFIAAVGIRRDWSKDICKCKEP